MTIFTIICICLLSLCLLTGVIMLFRRKAFLTVVPECESKSLFGRCFYEPFFVSLLELVLSLASLVLLICDCVNGGKLNDYSQVFIPCMLAGIILGVVLGEAYWRKTKKPFFLKNFPKEYQEYVEEVKNMWVKVRVRYYEEGTVGNFLFPFYSLGLLVGIVVVILL